MEYGKRNLSKQIIKPAKLANMFSGNAENQSKQNQQINKSKSADVKSGLDKPAVAILVVPLNGTEVLLDTDPTTVPRC